MKILFVFLFAMLLSTGFTVAGQPETLIGTTIKKAQPDLFFSLPSLGHCATARTLQKLPVEDVSRWLALQPGYAHGHLRGGRANELNRRIDGFDVIDPFYFRDAAVVPELQALGLPALQSGVSGAEYGGALSGTLDLWTRPVKNNHFGRLAGYLGNYVTSHDDIFIGLTPSGFDRNMDFHAEAGGPVFGKNFGYFVNVRYQRNKNHLNGIRRFLVDDYSDFSPSNPERWYSEHSGDHTYMPMQNENRLSSLAKLGYHPGPRLKTEFLILLNSHRRRNYRHMFKYNPNGLPEHHHRSWLAGLSVEFKPVKNIKWQTRAAQSSLYRGFYVFENPGHSGYVHDHYLYSGNTGFYTGGQDKNHNERRLDVLQIKSDLEWVWRNMALNGGLDYKQYVVENRDSHVVNQYAGTAEANRMRFDRERQEMVFLNYSPELSANGDFYRHQPRTLSVFLQDRIAFENIEIRIGGRYQQFESDGDYPSDYRNPADRTLLVESGFQPAKTHHRFSPRLAAVFSPQNSTRVRLAYGHFYQMPPFYALYVDADYSGAYSGYTHVLGKTNLGPQKKVEYEAGLEQKLSPFFDFWLTLFSREYSDLLGMREERTVLNTVYGVFDNNENAMSRGVELGFDYQKDAFFAMLNYTIMTAKANLVPPSGASTSYSDWQDRSDQRVFPMRWDQRHTLHGVAGFETRRLCASVGLYYHSGQRYTPEKLSSLAQPRVFAGPNSAVRPATLSADLFAWYRLVRFQYVEIRFLLRCCNIFDALNEISVYNDSGRAYKRHIDPDDAAEHRSDFNDYIDRIQNPAMYAAPRLVKIGLELVY